MPNNFTLLVFDWDGTLMDSAEAIVAALQAACRDLGVPIPPDERARYIIGLGLVDALKYAVPALADADYSRLVERYRHHFLLRDAQTALFPDVERALHDLRAAGFLLAVATGKSRRGLDRALQATGLAEVFHASRCADETQSKPHPAMLNELMQQLGTTPATTLMIGDTTHDLQMASNAGVAALAAAYGAHSREQLLSLSPLACMDEFAAVKLWIDQHG
jgi:phosphoglycolate phosphatase